MDFYKCLPPASRVGPVVLDKIDWNAIEATRNASMHS